MGWNTCAIFVKNRPANVALKLLSHEPTSVVVGETVDAATATSTGGSGAFYSAEALGWCQIWDPEGQHVFGLEAPLAEPNTVLAVIFGSVSSTYGFTIFQQGDLIRQAIYADGQLVAEEGEPLPVEGGIEVPEWGPDEDWLWAIIQAVTGVQHDQTVRFTVYRSPG